MRRERTGDRGAQAGLTPNPVSIIVARTMAKTKKRTAKRTTKRTATRSKLVCPECGFKAAHAMGLGRHRSARHGVVSKRQQMRRGPSPASATDGRRARAIERRLAELERRYDDLLGGLTKALSSARKRGR